MATNMLPFFTVDVFTRKPFSGNPLAIVLDADELSTAQMQTMAREFNLSETIFVQTPDNSDHTAKVRIFFPTDEIPFAGHPTIGCAIFLADRLHGADSDYEKTITLEEVAGFVPVKVVRKNGQTNAQFVAPVLPFRTDGVAPSNELAASALGLVDNDIGYDNHINGIFQGGPAFLNIPVRNLDVLGTAKVCEPSWSQMLEAAKVDSAYVYTFDAKSGKYRSRMFSPTAGIPEDPATGSATAILSGQLLAAGALEEGENEFNLEQGVEMGRASQLNLQIDVDQGSLQQVRVAGSSIEISSGQIRIPDLS